jgi:hypothetical protein
MPSLSKCILSLRGTIIKHDKKDKEVLNTLDEAYLQASRLENEEDSTSKSEIHNELTALLRNYNDLEDRKMAKKRDYVCIAMVVANVVCAWSRYIWETPAPQLLQFLTKLCQIHGNWVHKMTAETLIPTEVIGHEEGLYADMKTRMAKLVEAAACAVSRQSAVSQLSFSPISMCDVTPIISPDICEVRLTVSTSYVNIDNELISWSRTMTRHASLRPKPLSRAILRRIYSLPSSSLVMICHGKRNMPTQC